MMQLALPYIPMPQKRLRQRRIKSKNKKLNYPRIKQFGLDFGIPSVKMTYLTYCRNRSKISQDNLAKKIGISRISIYLYENTKPFIPEDKLSKIARFFNEPLKNFEKNNGEILEVPNEVAEKVLYTKRGYHPLERHNPKEKVFSVDDKTTVKIGSSYNKLLSGRWK